MRIMIVLKLNSVASATGELHSLCTLVFNNLCIPGLMVSFLMRSMLGS